MPKKRSLARTKLAAPRARGRILQRKRLLNILNENIDKELVVLCADAGYGKTTLLSQFCSNLKAPYFFYGLESSDNDLTVLFEHILFGIKKMYPNFGERTASIIGKTSELEILTGTFLNEFYQSIDKSFFMIFDDYQYLQNSSNFDLALDYVLAHAPPNLHIIIASRVTPGLALTRYLARQQLLIIEREHLKFDLLEIEELMKDIYKLNVTKKEIARIQDHSEGWVTAIQLIMQKIIAQGEQNANQALDDYIASGKEIFNYFANEVFENQPLRIRQFLIKTSIFKELTPKICNEFLNIKNSREFLERIENRHVFVSRMAVNSYRYNRLFKDYLSGITSVHHSPDEICDLHARLGKILQAHGEFESAIEHFIKGNRYEMAIACIKKVAVEVKPAGVHRKVLDWLAAVEDKYINEDLSIMFIKAEALDFFYEIEKALKLYKMLELRAEKEQDARALICATNGIAKIYVSSRQFDNALQYIQKSYKIGKTYSIDKKELIKIYNLEGICYDYLGNLDKAHAAYNKGLDIIEKYRLPKRNYAYLLNNITILSYIKGDFHTALKSFQELIKTDPNPLNYSTIHSNTASVLLDLGYFRQARKALKDSFTYSRQYMNKRAFLMFLYTLANYYLEAGEYEKAGSYYKRLINLSRECKEEFTVNVGKAGLMKTYYHAGKSVPARRLLKELFTHNHLKLHIHTHGMFLYKALIELQSKNIKQAESTLLKCMRWIEKTGYKFSRMMNYYYLALLYVQVKNENKALLFAEKTIEMARTHHYDHTILSEGRKDGTFIQFALKKTRYGKYIHDIVSKMYQDKGCSVRFFGNFQVSINWMPIKKENWQTEKARLLFAYLVFNRDEGVSKDRLINEFYRQSKPSMADQNIRKTLSRVRCALMWDNAVIQIRGTFKVNPLIKFNIDTEEFEKLIEEILNTGSDTRLNLLRKYHRLTRIYRGGFLDGMQNEWCMRTRKYFKDRYISSLQIIAKHLDESKKPASSRLVYEEISRIK